MNSVSVAVIGAGLAGIACAQRLQEAGVQVRVFEAQRAPGGRLATRRFAVATFDHGAQFLTATDLRVSRSCSRPPKPRVRPGAGIRPGRTANGAAISGSARPP